MEIFYLRSDTVCINMPIFFPNYCGWKTVWGIYLCMIHESQTDFINSVFSLTFHCILCATQHILRREEACGKICLKTGWWLKIITTWTNAAWGEQRGAIFLIKLFFPNLSGGSWKNHIPPEAEQRLRCQAWSPQSLKELGLEGGGMEGGQCLNKRWKVEHHGEKTERQLFACTIRQEKSCQQTFKCAIQTRTLTKGNLNPVKFVPNVSYCSTAKGSLGQHYLLLYAQQQSCSTFVKLYVLEFS